MDTALIQITKLSNVVGASCRVGDFDWAIALVHKYCPFINASQRKSAYHLNVGVMEFYKKKL